MNQKIKISIKNYLKVNSINFSYSYIAQNTINSKRKKNLIKIRLLSQISEMRKSNILFNNKKLSNLKEVKSNLSQKINKHKLIILEMLKENEKKKHNYASIELSYLISQTSNKSIYNNNKKKNINIKPFKISNNNLEKKQKEKAHLKKTKINNVLKSTINLNKKINKRTYSLTTSVSKFYLNFFIKFQNFFTSLFLLHHYDLNIKILKKYLLILNDKLFFHKNYLINLIDDF